MLISWVNDKRFDFKDNTNRTHKNLPVGVNNFFSGSGKCEGCHGPDPQQIASVDADSNDVNVMSSWRSTMMANSAKDPFWRAKVSHEVIMNPGHQLELEDKCTSCHAPLGHFNAKLLGQVHYSLADMDSDSIALDGVSCSACHQIDPNEAGKYFSGNVVYDTNKVIFGQIDNPFSAPMQSFVGFDAQYEPKISTSVFCADCHTLITSTVDLAGNYTGDEFVEQATYHEWLNSQYSTGLNKRECQSCHMERLEDPVILAVDYSFIGGRIPFAMHDIVGGNAFMLELFKNNIDSLGLNADTTQFNNTLELTKRMLKDSSLNLNLTELSRDVDSVYYELALENLCGHKLPSGYPSRRMFVQFVVFDSLGDTLFKSGTWDANYEVIGHDPNYETHFDIIKQNDEVQIYEMVFADVNGVKSTILERADSTLKDNRLPPKGFTSAHQSYDTTQVSGLALLDDDFNLGPGSVEGSGIDLVNYHVPLNGYAGDLNVCARVYYQTAPPAWMAEMFSNSSYEIDRFKQMFDDANREPILMKQIKEGDLFLDVAKNIEAIDWLVYPNPSNGVINFKGFNTSDVRRVEVYNMAGSKVFESAFRQQLQLDLPNSTYLLRVLKKDGSWLTKKVIIQN